MEIIKSDIAILGGGAGGLMCGCAINKSDFNGTSVIIEAQNRCGKKLLATGNGRCNLSNKHITTNCYLGSGKAEALNLFKKYNTSYIINYFENLGLLCRGDNEGRIYPLSNSASSVLDVLRLSLVNTKEYCSCKIESIKKEKDKYIISCKEKIFEAKKIIFTLGGKASPKLSSDGDGYKLLKSLGYNINSLMPSLSPVKVSSPLLPSLKGIRVKGNISLYCDNKLIKKESGEIQFTDNSLSGIAVFQLSPFVNEFFTKNTIQGKKYKQIMLSIDLLPEKTLDETLKILEKRKKTFANLCSEYFTGIFHKRIGLALLKNNNIPTDKNITDLTSKEISLLAKNIKDWQFMPKCISDFNTAQVTGGGIDAGNINFNTMESKRDKGLYFAGEIVDVDGICGGYNLHWAWTSAIIAGENAVKSLER